MLNLTSRLLDLARLRPLAELGAVAWFDQREPPRPDWRWGPSYGDLSTADEHELAFWARALDDARWSAHRAPALEIMRNINPALPYIDAEVALKVSRSGYGSVLARSPLELWALSRWNTVTPTKREELLYTLLRLAVPDGQELSLRDLESLRRSSQHYAAWRASLELALRAVDDLTDSQTAPQDGAGILKEYLQPEADRLKAALVNAGAWGAFSHGLSTLSIASLGAGASAALTHTLAPAFAGAAAVSLGEALRTFANARRVLRSDRALLAHFVSLQAAEAARPQVVPDLITVGLPPAPPGGWF